MGSWTELEDGRLVEELQNKVEKLELENQELKEELNKEKAENATKEFRIRNELEPRLQEERASYDCWVSTGPGLEGNEAWESWLDQMIDMVANYPEWFDWENSTGELDQKILYLIKMHLSEKDLSEKNLGVKKV